MNSSPDQFVASKQRRAPHPAVIERLITFMLTCTLLAVSLYLWRDASSLKSFPVRIMLAASALSLGRLSAPIWTTLLRDDQRGWDMAYDGLLTGLTLAAGFAWLCGTPLGGSLTLVALAAPGLHWVIQSRGLAKVYHSADAILSDRSRRLAETLRFKSERIVLDETLDNPARLTLTPTGYWLRLSGRWMTSLSDGERHAVIAHELAHFRRKTLLADACIAVLRNISAIGLCAWLVLATGRGGAAPGAFAAAALALACYETLTLIPILHLRRRGELAADRFALRHGANVDALLGARRKMTFERRRLSLLERFFLSDQPDCFDVEQNMEHCRRG